MKLIRWVLPAMMRLALFGGLVFAARAAPAPGPADAVVRTDAGPVQGRVEDGLIAFRGLRYAAPPVGERRWREPQPLVPWQDIQDARSPGRSCIQKPEVTIASGVGDPRPMGEDCLFLNVWTPRTEPAARLPVMVWIHGGALVIGAGGLPIYDGGPLASRGAVVVTLNYRLGALGFFAHPALAREGRSLAANFGLLDQIAALRWVQRNIAAFGGDPGNVTIFGQSAGAESVLALFVSPLATGLFHKGIAQSPYGIPSHPLPKARDTAAKVATALHLNGAAATAAELRGVPADAFEALDGPGLSLAPTFIVGDDALPQPILSAFQKGGEAQLPLVVGNTSDDGSIAREFGLDPAAIVKRLGAARLLVKPLYPGGTSDEQLGRETVRDLVFTAFARRIAFLHSSRAPTWRYYYAYLPTAQRGQRPGVGHGAEVAYTMGTFERCQCLGAPASGADRDAAARINAHWIDFARSGTPVPDDADRWPRDGRRGATLLEFADTDTVRPDFMKRRLDAFIGALNVIGRFTGPR